MVDRVRRCRRRRCQVRHLLRGHLRGRRNNRVFPTGCYLVGMLFGTCTEERRALVLTSACAHAGAVAIAYAIAGAVAI
eukprot:7937730-Pyramimonas_sp.AAC.1